MNILGDVVGPEGEPVVGAFVVAYDARLGYIYGTTDSTGGFEIVDVPSGDYRLRVIPKSDDPYAERWEDAGLRFCEAPAHALQADLLDVHIELELGGSIAGRLVDPLGQPIPDVTVVARADADGATVQSRSAVTGIDGRFTILGLPTVDEEASVGYHVEFQSLDRPLQYLGETYSRDDQELVAVVAGEVTDLSDRRLLSGVTIGGSVTDPDGDPIDGGSAHVYSNSQVVDVPIVAGRYEARGLPPGEVLSWAIVDGWALTYYPASDRPGERVEVLGEGTVYDTLDLVVQPEARLVGTLVTDGGLDLSGVPVLAYNDARSVGIGGSSTDGGALSLGRLPVGDWTLFVFGSDAGTIDGFAEDSPAVPEVFGLSAGTNDVGEIYVPAGATLSGTVLGDDGEPAYGVGVVATRIDGADVRRSEADPAGTYAIEGLSSGFWRLGATFSPFCPTDRGYAPIYYVDARDEALGGGLDMAGGEAYEWDIRVARDDDHDAMGDAWESAHGLDPAGDDSALDPDADGYTNLEEYLLGTDPTGDSTGGDPRTCGCSTSGGRFGFLTTLGAAAAVLVGRRRNGVYPSVTLG